jgi:ArsR family metal-binding transcriptional regulator
MYLEAISLTRTTPCLAEPGKIIVTGKPSRRLDEVLPYLASLPGVISYNPGAGAVTFRRPSGFLTIYPQRIFITQVRDLNEGLELLASLKDAINATWESRENLIAAKSARRTPRPLDIWTLLPQTNCKECGEETCMAFACSLLLQARYLVECKPIYNEPLYIERLTTLIAMLGNDKKEILE